MTLAVWLDWDRYRFAALVGALAAAVLAENALLITAAARRGFVRPYWAAADVAFLVLSLLAGAALTASADGRTWAYFMYPLSLFSCYSIGIAFEQLWSVLGWTAVLASGYGVAAVAIHHDRPWNVVLNALGYFADTVITWVVARQLRRGARAVDDSRAEAIEQAGELARQREQARHARILHDHALQTLESLVRQDSIPDRNMRAYVAAEARRLRSLVEGIPLEEPADLLSRLQELTAAKAAAGLDVEFSHAQLSAPGVSVVLPQEVIDAVADAACEALTNVARHAGVRTAILRATVARGRLIVSVLDQGRGFEAGQACGGIGLRESIGARLRDVGGSALIQSGPGEGTYIELTVPIAAGLAVLASPYAG